MKLSKKILAALSAAALLATTALFASCSDDEDDGKNGTTYATLPESVGENPFAGKTWKYQRTSNGKEYSHSWSFTDTTATNSNGEEETTYTYKYSYDANQNLLYLAFQTESWTEDGETISYSSVEEYKEVVKKWYEDEGDSISEAEMESELERIKKEFSTLGVRKYTISEDSLTLEDYFDGKLPTACYFYKSFDESDLPSEYTSGFISIDCIGLYDSEYDYRYNYYLSFNSEAKTFSGNMYSYKSSKDDDFTTKLGTVTGTYTTEGIGTSGCKVTLTFTEIPDGVPVIKTNTAYELEQNSDSDATYTYALVK
ncbi:MAG: hypothetical protein IJ717_11195 [Treponema sp.]|nr:hypothetical protein [Treponema sp.]